MRRLREIDPLYDLHYLGEGCWCVGRVQWTSERYAIAGKLWRGRDGGGLQRDNVRSFARIAIPQLGMQGFGTVALYDIEGEPDARIVTDIRERAWNWRNRAEAEFEERLARSDRASGGARYDDAFWDDIGYRDRHMRPEVFRSRKHFRYGASA